jgi:hypothetical protein
MRKTVVLVLVLVSAAVAQAQVPATESEWRSEHEKVNADYGSAKSNKWGGIVLAGLGGALTAFGASHKKQCSMGPGGLARLMNPDICDQYKGRADWRMVGPGLGALGGGAMIILKQLRKEHQSAERLKELDDAGKQRGWTVSTGPTSFRVAFRW